MPGAGAYAQEMGSVLNDRQIEQYQRDGFLVIEGFAEQQACNELKAAANHIVDEFQPSTERTIFTTTEQERVSNGEFLASGSGIWCFFEEEAFDADGQPRTPKALSINKIGHAMHDLDPTFEKFSYRPELAGVAADIGLADALALQSMYIFKQPLIGGEVGCHQDSTFLYTEPMTVTGFWFAIEDATLAERLPVGQARRTPHQPAQVVQARREQRCRRHRLRGARSGTTAVAVRARAARGAGRHDGHPARPAPPLERHQPVGDQPPRLFAALHLGVGRVSRVELAATPAGHAAAVARRVSPHEHPQPAQGVCCTTISTAACARPP